MKNKKDFSEMLETFFLTYLPGELGLSPHTIRSYRDTFVLFISYMDNIRKTSPDKIQFSDFTKEEVLFFLRWLEDSKGNTPNTRNQRLAALKSFSKMVMYKCPEYVSKCSDILAIRAKKQIKDVIKYISFEELTCLLSQINTKTRPGRRDLVLISLLYNTGARVQELINLTPADFRLDNPATVEFLGKGNKKRIVPLEEPIAKLVEGYLKEQGLSHVGKSSHPLFFNARHEALTTPGVTYIINKYVPMVRNLHPEMLTIKITPHVFRHSRAMHLLQGNVPLPYIRDLLGHVSVVTTEIYAKVDSKLKREALEKAYENLGVKEPETKSWDEKSKLKSFLKSLA
jgi:site-specific recombinase XerD